MTHQIIVHNSKIYFFDDNCQTYVALWVGSKFENENRQRERKSEWNASRKTGMCKFQTTTSDRTQRVHKLNSLSGTEGKNASFL